MLLGGIGVWTISTFGSSVRSIRHVVFSDTIGWQKKTGTFSANREAK